MLTEGQREVIRFLLNEGNNGKAIFERMSIMYGKEAPAYSTVKHWVKQFRMGRTCVKDEPRSGRPNEASNEETVKQVEQLVLVDRRITLRQLEALVSIGKSTIQRILNEHLNMKKVAARWVPKFLTDLDKQRRLESSNQILDEFGDKWEELTQRIVTMDETGFIISIRNPNNRA